MRTRAQLGRRACLTPPTHFRHSLTRSVMVWELVEGSDLLDLLNSVGGSTSEQVRRRSKVDMHDGVDARA